MSKLDPTLVLALAKLSNAIPHQQRASLGSEFDTVLKACGSSLSENKFLVGRRPEWNNPAASKRHVTAYDVVDLIVDIGTIENMNELGRFAASRNQLAKFCGVTVRTIDLRLMTAEQSKSGYSSIIKHKHFPHGQVSFFRSDADKVEASGVKSFDRLDEALRRYTHFPDGRLRY